MTCRARTKRGSFWGSRRCGRPVGHKGQHRCRHMKDGTGTKQYKRVVPCNYQWGRRQHAKANK